MKYEVSLAKVWNVASAWETRAAAAAGAESVRSRPQPSRESEEVKHNVALWDKVETKVTREKTPNLRLKL